MWNTYLNRFTMQIDLRMQYVFCGYTTCIPVYTCVYTCCVSTKSHSTNRLDMKNMLVKTCTSAFSVGKNLQLFLHSRTAGGVVC